jgi:hypothetical protein
MRECTTKADALNPDAVIAMPDDGTSMDDYRAFSARRRHHSDRSLFNKWRPRLPPTTSHVELAKEFRTSAT